MPIRKLYGFDRSFQSLDSSSNNLLHFGVTIKVPMKLAKDLVLHQRSKHIELHMHFIRNLVHNHVLEVLFFPTDDQVANIFTKFLIEVKFFKLQSMLGVQEFFTKGG